jgi:hypothetical protein
MSPLGTQARLCIKNGLKSIGKNWEGLLSNETNRSALQSFEWVAFALHKSMGTKDSNSSIFIENTSWIYKETKDNCINVDLSTFPQTI